MRVALVNRFILLAALVMLPLAMIAPANAAPYPCADLAITGFSTNPTSPIAGVPASISITVKNQGSCSTNTSFVVQWKQSSFASTGPSTTMGPLAAGASAVANLTYTFPFQGNYLSLLEIDTNDAIAETNEVNNLAIRSVTVQKATIDLLITDFYVLPNPGPRANEFMAFIDVTNTGNVPSGQFQVEWEPTTETPALTDTVANLGAGSSTTVMIPYTYPSIGLFTTKARVDATRLVRETNEFNNTAYTTVLVVPDRPDLIVTDISFSPAVPVAGQNVNVTVFIKNDGFEDAGPFAVSWQPSPLGATQSQQVAGLAEGASTSVVFSNVYAFAGSFDTTAVVDSNSAVFEINELNNEYSEPVVVLPGLSDLTITSLTASPSSPDQGENVVVSVNIHNAGTEAAGPFVVSWNPDAFGLIVPSVGTLTQQVNSLGAGASTTVQFNFTYPIAGPFHTIAEVDAFDTVNETNEVNNLKILDLVVDDDNLNLDVTGFTITPGNPDRFESVTASITVKNTGNLPVGWFQIKWLMATTNISGPTKWVPGLNPGESVTVEMTGLYWQAGSYTSRAIADSTNIIVETNEGDNTQDKAITVNPLP